MKKVAVIPGDGIGPEVIAEARAVLGALALPIDFIEAEAGLACRARTGSYFPDATRAAVEDADAVLFGAITSPLASEDASYTSVVLELRRMLDAYANVRPAFDLGQPCQVPGLRLVLIRENSEGEYNAPEVADAEGVTTHRRITRRGCERIVRFAFDYAQANGRRRLTCVHKANVLRASDGLFLDTFRARARAQPSVRGDDILVDNCALQLVREPARFEVFVTLNLYGDILSDLAAGLVGGLGFAPSGNYGPTKALFEPVHGSAPDIAGKGVANPAAAILSAAMMLRHLGFPEDAARIDRAVTAALARGRTQDAGGTLSTREFGDLVRLNLR